MKLYIRQKAFSFVEKFFVKDENGADKYYVEGEFFTLGKKLHVYDMNGSEVMYLSQKPFTFLPKVDIYIGTDPAGTLVKSFTMFTQKYTLQQTDSTTLEVTGDFMAHEYTALRDSFPVATVSREWFTWGDSYALDIADCKDELLCMGILLAIDIINASQAGVKVTIGSN